MTKLTDRPPAGPPRSPFLTPPPQPQLPPAPAALQQRAAVGFILAVLSIIAMLLIGNWERAGYVFGVACVVAATGFGLAVSAMRAARRLGTRRPRGSAAAAVLGGICAAGAGLATIAFLIFGPQLSQYANCMKAAGSSSSAQSSCHTDLENAINARPDNGGR